jgi:hypothetical protein
MNDRRQNVKTFIVSSAGLATSIALHYERSADWKIQENLIRNGRWIINDREPIGRLLFYTGPKGLLIGFGLFLLLAGAIKF